MIYRILGGISLGIGAIFGLVAFLVFLPFISNLNIGLLILAGVFAILAWVFVSIGWQLFHPPEKSSSPGMLERVILGSEEEQSPEPEEAQEEPGEEAGEAPEVRPEPAAARPAAEEARAAAAAAAAADEGWSGAGPASPEVPPEKTDEAPRRRPAPPVAASPASGQEESSSKAAQAENRADSGSFVGFGEGRSGNGRDSHDREEEDGDDVASQRTRFKKPGAPVPRGKSR